MKALDRVDLLESRTSRLKRIVQKEESRLSLLSTFRILAFLGFFSWIIATYILRTSSELYYLPAFLILGLFYKLLSVYQKHKERVRRLIVWSDFVQTQKSRLLIDGKGYPKPKKEYYKNLLLQNELPPWTKDLDFLGEKGLFSRIDSTVTNRGTISFLGYFLQRKEGDEIRNRQQVVSLLSDKKSTVQKLLRQFRLYEASFPFRKDGEEEKLPSYIPTFGTSPKDDSVSDRKDFPFHLFGEVPTDFWKFSFGSFGRVVRFLFPVWLFLIWILVFGSLLFAQTWAAGFFLLNFAFFGFYRAVSLRMIRPIAEDSETLDDLGKLLLYVRNSRIRGIADRIFLGDWSRKELRTSWQQLNKISNLAAYTQSPLAHGLLNVLFFFDLWVWRRYGNWWNSWGSKILPALQDICELDSILPLANLQWIEPEFSFPILEKENEQKGISAKALIHPLIPAHKRVSNDLDPIIPGKLLLLTGSNMSGKTTYLRAVGICGVLAMAGGPVPAARFETPILDIHSSIRNEDSVEEGISFFYAEVRRLGKILQDVSDPDKGHLVLLDEILKGTNSRERTIACKGILNKLRSFGVFGIVTTHDLELADLEDLVLFHFREEILEGKMTFDYKIRPGVVQSSNALEVLKLEGLDL